MNDTQQLVVLYSFQITGTSGLDITFKPTVAGHMYSIQSMLALANEPIGITWNDVGAAMFEKTFGSDDAKFNPTTTAAASGPDIVSTIGGSGSGWTDGGSGWALDMLLGFDTSNGGLNPHGATDYYHMKLTNALYSSITQINLKDSSTNIGGVSSGLTVLYDVFGSSVIYLPVTVTDVFDSVTGSKHDVAAFGGVVSGSDGTNWNYAGGFSDKSDFALNAVPEPASIAVWGLLLGLVGAVGWAHRRRS